MKWEKNNLIMESFPVGTLACNCCIIYEKETREALIIDPGNDSDLILKFVAQKKLKVKSLLHTHAHFDHIGGSSFLSTELNCPVHLHTDDFFLHKALPLQAMYFGEKIPEPKPVDHIIRDEETFGLNLSNLVNPQESKLIPFLKTLHTPGHTPGSCCFYSEYFDPNGPSSFLGANDNAGSCFLGIGIHFWIYLNLAGFSTNAWFSLLKNNVCSSKLTSVSW